MRIQPIEPLAHRAQPGPGEYAAGRCHACHGSTARWLITFSRQRPFLKLCAKCAEHLIKRLSEMIAGRMEAQAVTVEQLSALEDDNRGNR